MLIFAILILIFAIALGSKSVLKPFQRLQGSSRCILSSDSSSLTYSLEPSLDCSYILLRHKWLISDIQNRIISWALSAKAILIIAALYIIRYISLNPLFLSQKNTFFFLGSKNNLFEVLALANYTFFPFFGQFVYTTPKKFLILWWKFLSRQIIKPCLRKNRSELVAHRRKQMKTVRRCQVWWVSGMG